MTSTTRTSIDTVLSLCPAQDQDRPLLLSIGEAIRKPDAASYFDTQLFHQTQKQRVIWLALWEGQAAGYCIYNRAPKYAYYRVHNIPEIQDLNVLPAFRRKGIASALIGQCERVARGEGAQQMGISFGLDAGYGPAQILYWKLGYRPDGQGVTYDRQIVTHGEFRPVDDQLCLMLVKDLC